MKPAVRLVLSAVGLAVALAVGLVLIETPVAWPVRCVGAATLFMALMPGLKYLADPPAHRRPVPLLPLVGLIYGIYFGRPFAFGSPGALAGDWSAAPGGALMGPALLALLGWTLLLFAYWLAGRVYRPRGWDLSRAAPRRILWRAGLLLAGVGMALELGEYVLAIPTPFAGLWSLLGRLGWVGAGFLVASWVLGELGTWLKLCTVFSVVVLSIFEISTGMVANPARFWLLLLLAVWIAKGRRAPAKLWLAGIAVGLIMVMLRGVAMEYRQRAWYGEDLGPMEKVGTYYSVLAERVRNEGFVGLLTESAQLVGGRTSQATVLVDVVRRTPESVPYWGGETYVSLVGALVPRFLWPSKPTKNLGQRFGHRYSYLDPTDETTSFNLPFLVEFYANFGALGILIGMSVVGGLYRLIDDILNRRRGRNVLASVLALGLLVPIGTSIESDFSLVFGGLVLNGMALYLILRLVTTSRPGRHYSDVPAPST